MQTISLTLLVQFEWNVTGLIDTSSSCAYLMSFSVELFLSYSPWIKLKKTGILKKYNVQHHHHHLDKSYILYIAENKYPYNHVTFPTNLLITKYNFLIYYHQVTHLISDHSYIFSLSLGALSSNITCTLYCWWTKKK